MAARRCSPKPVDVACAARGLFCVLRPVVCLDALSGGACLSGSYRILSGFSASQPVVMCRRFGL
eukprot:15441233-Alexandrium_andersonii.AAC.1